jgi:hypothetical protein
MGTEPAAGGAEHRSPTTKALTLPDRLDLAGKLFTLTSIARQAGGSGSLAEPLNQGAR